MSRAPAPAKPAAPPAPNPALAPARPAMPPASDPALAFRQRELPVVSNPPRVPAKPAAPPAPRHRQSRCLRNQGDLRSPRLRQVPAFRQRELWPMRRRRRPGCHRPPHPPRPAPCNQHRPFPRIRLPPRPPCFPRLPGLGGRSPPRPEPKTQTSRFDRHLCSRLNRKSRGSVLGLGGGGPEPGWGWPAVTSRCGCRTPTFRPPCT